jgi:hypothetical protein
LRITRIAPNCREVIPPQQTRTHDEDGEQPINHAPMADRGVGRSGPVLKVERIANFTHQHTNTRPRARLSLRIKPTELVASVNHQLPMTPAIGLVLMNRGDKEDAWTSATIWNGAMRLTDQQSTRSKH